MTCSQAGGLPLGFIIILSECEKIIIVEFEKLKEVFLNYARGKMKGSKLFMTESEYIVKKEELLSVDICLRYSHYIKHLEDGYFNRKEVWVIFFYNEASFRLTRDGQFNITKAYNLSDLLDVVLDDSVFY